MRAASWGVSACACAGTPASWVARNAAAARVPADSQRRLRDVKDHLRGCGVCPQRYRDREIRQCLGEIPGCPYRCVRVRLVINTFRDEQVRTLVDLVRVPCVAGTDAAVVIVDRLAGRLRSEGVEIDRWPIPVAEFSARSGFP